MLQPVGSGAGGGACAVKNNRSLIICRLMSSYAESFLESCPPAQGSG
jgi:hypothetical protein